MSAQGPKDPKNSSSAQPPERPDDLLHENAFISARPQDPTESLFDALQSAKEHRTHHTQPTKRPSSLDLETRKKSVFSPALLLVGFLGVSGTVILGSWVKLLFLTTPTREPAQSILNTPAAPDKPTISPIFQGPSSMGGSTFTPQQKPSRQSSGATFLRKKTQEELRIEEEKRADERRRDEEEERERQLQEQRDELNDTLENAAPPKKSKSRLKKARGNPLTDEPPPEDEENPDENPPEEPEFQQES